MQKAEEGMKKSILTRLASSLIAYRGWRKNARGTPFVRTLVGILSVGILAQSESRGGADFKHERDK